jgi:signal transduction histidine kinase
MIAAPHVRWSTAPREEKSMLRKIILGALAAIATMLCTATFANAQGTAPEAKAMLEKAVAAVKADKAKAIAMFNNGEGGFKDRDLYPFCFQLSDGIEVAGPPSVRGKDLRTIKGPNGEPFGAEIYKAVQDGKAEISYLFPKPGETTAVPKTSLLAKVDDLGCGVGYYK